MKKLKNVSRIKMYAAGTALGLSLLAGCEAKTQAPVESKTIETTIDNTDVIDSTEVVIATQVPETTETVEVPKTTEATPESTEVDELTEVVESTEVVEEAFECTADDFIKFIEATSPNYPQIDKAQLEAAVFALNFDYFNDEEKDKILDYCGCEMQDMSTNFQAYNDNMISNILLTSYYYQGYDDGDKSAYKRWIKISDMAFNEKDLEMAKEYDDVLEQNASINYGYIYIGEPKDLKQDTASSFELSCRAFQYSVGFPNIPVTVFDRGELIFAAK